MSSQQLHLLLFCLILSKFKQGLRVFKVIDILLNVQKYKKADHVFMSQKNSHKYNYV